MKKIPTLFEREFENHWSSTLYVQSQNPQKSVKLKEQRWRESQ